MHGTSSSSAIPKSGAVDFLSEKVNCAVINAGDGGREHPDPGAADALTIRRRMGRRAEGGDLRRHSALAGGALEHPP